MVRGRKSEGSSPFSRESKEIELILLNIGRITLQCVK
jgi:hypothetical protein